MSITFQTHFTNLQNLHCFHFRDTHFTSIKNPNLNFFKKCPHVEFIRPRSSNPRKFTSLKSLRSLESRYPLETDSKGLDFDKILVICELVCLSSSAFASIGYALSYAVFGPEKVVVGWLGNRVYLVWQAVVFVCGVVIGAWIRTRQWRRICGMGRERGGGNGNLVVRIEKLEEDIRSSAAIIRGMSRQLEKLGIRFRVTRKNLKEPISETAALAQKNSEVTRALAIKEDNLERELGEIQNVLLAMQEQQQKQLELIVAIGKSGNLWDNKGGPNKKQDAFETNNSIEEDKVMPTRTDQIHSVASKKETIMDKPYEV